MDTASVVVSLTEFLYEWGLALVAAPASKKLIERYPKRSIHVLRNCVWDHFCRELTPGGNVSEGLANAKKKVGGVPKRRSYRGGA